MPYEDDSDRFDLDEQASALDEPVYEESVLCGSCGREVDELFPCYWEPSIQVGSCCSVHSDQEPLCAAALEIVLRAKTVLQLVEQIREHCATCRDCGEQPQCSRKDVQAEGPATSGPQQGVA